MPHNVYDTIIIGAGPAGFTAGIYASRREMKTLIIGKEIGGQVLWASDIENYPGFNSINSIDLIEKLKAQVARLGVEVANDEVKQIEKDGSEFKLNTATLEYRARTVIITMGLSPRRLAIQGEQEFTGRGVSYCANCDGPFYRDKTVAVVGGGNAALDAAEILSKIAGKVYLVHRRNEFRAFESLVQDVAGRTNVEIFLNCEIKKISGQGKVEKILLSADGEKDRELAVDGVFIEIGRIAHTDLVADFVERNERSQVIVDEKCRTKTPGLFAAGDVTTVPYKQITIACGQATIAALAAYEYLQVEQGKKVNGIYDRSKTKEN